MPEVNQVAQWNKYAIMLGKTKNNFVFCREQFFGASLVRVPVDSHDDQT